MLSPQPLPSIRDDAIAVFGWITAEDSHFEHLPRPVLSVVFAPVIYSVGAPAPDNPYVDFVLWCGHRGGQDRADSMQSDVAR